MSSWRKYAVFALPVLSIAFLLLAGEVAIRVWHLVRWDISLLEGLPKNAGRLSSISADPQLGWRATPNYRFEGRKGSADGSSYFVEVSQDANGFRIFGNPGSRKPKVLVIGDSFTQAVDASDTKTYYARLESLGLEVFAYGGGGYGTLQELMVLRKYYDLIRPALVVWQFSTNDLVNNSPAFEAASTINNNDMLRPYWVDGEIRYVLPRSAASRLRRAAHRYCRLCYMVLNRYDRIRASMSLGTVETETGPGKPANRIFVDAEQVTDRIMSLVREQIGPVPIIGFIVGAGGPYGPEYIDALKAIAKKHDIVMVDVESAVLAAEKAGTIVRAADGAHWNEAGHQIAGQALANALRSTALYEPGLAASELSRRLSSGSGESATSSPPSREGGVVVTQPGVPSLQRSPQREAAPARPSSGARGRQRRPPNTEPVPR
jgi:hypothetical protein